MKNYIDNTGYTAFLQLDPDSQALLSEWITGSVDVEHTDVQKIFNTSPEIESYCKQEKIVFSAVSRSDMQELHKLHARNVSAKVIGSLSEQKQRNTLAWVLRYGVPSALAVGLCTFLVVLLTPAEQAVVPVQQQHITNADVVEFMSDAEYQYTDEEIKEILLYYTVAETPYTAVEYVSQHTEDYVDEMQDKLLYEATSEWSY